VHKSVWDDHAKFEERVGKKAYLLSFHKMISAMGAENIESLMKAELSNVVDEINIDTTTASESCKRQRPMQNKGRAPLSFGTKEKTNETILKYINSSLTECNNLMEQMTTSHAGTASTKYNYIRREKNGIAVCLDDQAMARDVSDAVNLSLQKWKATLKELHEMEASGIQLITLFLLPPEKQRIYVSLHSTLTWQELKRNRMNCLHQELNS
jgi:hypothetical protein